MNNATLVSLTRFSETPCTKDMYIIKKKSIGVFLPRYYTDAPHPGIQ